MLQVHKHLPVSAQQKWIPGIGLENDLVGKRRIGISFKVSLRVSARQKSKFWSFSFSRSIRQGSSIGTLVESEFSK